MNKQRRTGENLSPFFYVLLYTSIPVLLYTSMFVLLYTSMPVCRYYCIQVYRYYLDELRLNSDLLFGGYLWYNRGVEGRTVRGGEKIVSD